MKVADFSSCLCAGCATANYHYAFDGGEAGLDVFVGVERRYVRTLVAVEWARTF